jgi:hypothetical protein
MLRKMLKAYQVEQSLLLVGVEAAETNEPGLQVERVLHDSALARF